MKKDDLFFGKVKNLLVLLLVGAAVGLLFGWILLGIVFDMMGMWFLWDIRLIIGGVLGMIIIPFAYYSTLSHDSDKKADVDAIEPR